MCTRRYFVCRDLRDSRYLASIFHIAPSPPLPSRYLISRLLFFGATMPKKISLIADFTDFTGLIRAVLWWPHYVSEGEIPPKNTEWLYLYHPGLRFVSTTQFESFSTQCWKQLECEIQKINSRDRRRNILISQRKFFNINHIERVFPRIFHLSLPVVYSHASNMTFR